MFYFIPPNDAELSNNVKFERCKDKLRLALETIKKFASNNNKKEQTNNKKPHVKIGNMGKEQFYTTTSKCKF